MRFGRILLGLAIVAAGVSGVARVSAQDPPGPVAPPPGARRVYTTQRLDTGAPILDGRPDDRAWDLVSWSGEFTQRSPYEGKPPSQPTEFKILYDDDALYIAYRAWDQEPERIRSEMARRDWFPGDWVEINIDSRGDQRTAFSFTSSASGVRGDEYISEDGRNWDSSWDPIWQLTTAVDDRGWTAEVRIPFSQLRFTEQDDPVWGIEVTRRIFRHEERSVWQFIPEDSPGWVSRFGELRGIQGLKAQKQIEIIPYSVGYAEHFTEEPGNPFEKGKDQTLSAGLDGKIGLSGNMILDLTVNPDFGQVEADPAQVNLSGFETFFTERRPFFIEGNEVLRYSLARAVTGGNFASDLLFYSRRVGRAPQREIDWEPGRFTDIPTSTNILGAAKLSGKTAGGVSLGMLEAVTSRERARVHDTGGDRREIVEPLTNYFVGRAQKEYSQGRTLIGGMVTAVHRDIEDPLIEFLPTAAYAGGLDFEHRWNDRSWQLLVRALASHVRGSRTAMLTTQTSSAHYFQRPDASHARLDTTRTSLSGASGSAYIGKGNGRWRFQTGAAWRSPGFEINDLGYMRQAGELNQSTWVGYYITKPFSIFREFAINTNQWLYWDADGKNLVRQFNVNTNLTFKNEWSLHADVTPTLEMRSNSLLRGGPSFLTPGSFDFSINLNTDGRRAILLEGGSYTSFSAEKSGYWQETWGDATYRPTRAMRMTLAASYSHGRNDLQYVDETGFQGEPRYLLASIVQRTAALSLRLDYCMTPNLTLQLYARPFISAGGYSAFKRVTMPGADRYADRFDPLEPGTELQLEDGAYYVDENRDGEADYAFSYPDFNYKAFNSNLVLRWEYRPGSTLFIVWGQTRELVDPTGRFALGDDVDALFAKHPHDVFLIKISRWLSI